MGGSVSGDYVCAGEFLWGLMSPYLCSANLKAIANTKASEGYNSTKVLLGT